VTETFVTPAGLRLAYERRGSGPLLVCHPGGPGASSAEFRDFAGLDDTFELVLLSPRGSLGSDAGPDYALSSYVDDLDALRAHLGVEAFDLLGFSHGGLVAIAYAAAHGGRVRRLVLADTLAAWGAEEQAAMERAIESRSGALWFADAQHAIAEEQAAAFATVEELVANVRRQMPLYFHRWEGHEEAGRELGEDFARMEPLHEFNTVEFPQLDLRGELTTIAAPALVLVGDDDFITGPVCADVLVQGLPDARLVVIPGAGHFSYVEQPQAFRDALVGFLT
jgi:pimeloyl-ACP methyl ester carboxylesterase